MAANEVASKKKVSTATDQRNQMIRDKWFEISVDGASCPEQRNPNIVRKFITDLADFNQNELFAGIERGLLSLNMLQIITFFSKK